MILKQIKKIAYSAIYFLLLGLGISLQIEAGIGQSMFNAFSMFWSDFYQIGIGTVINILNLFFFIIYLYMRHYRLNRKDFIPIVAVLVNGYIINLFTYCIFNHIIIQSYGLRIATFVLGLLIASMSLGAILALEIIRFPLESLCIVLSQKFEYSLSIVRMRFDIFFLVSTLILTLLTNHNLYIREGTMISFLLLSRLMGFSYNFLKRNMQKGVENHV